VQKLLTRKCLCCRMSVVNIKSTKSNSPCSFQEPEDLAKLYKEVPNDAATQQVLQFLTDKDPSLRWEFTFADPELEARRLQIYKFLRKRRYERAMETNGGGGTAAESRRPAASGNLTGATAISNPYVSRDESLNFLTRQQLLDAGYELPGSAAGAGK
uniref:SARAH domain-containing protein n=3 Tax=Macrostomum lignano TaxID=282301 RepID=A0A1I8GU59_9PLAT